MINLTEIKTTKRSYRDIESDLLIVGLFKNKELTRQLKRLDTSIEHELSNAMELDGFNGSNNTQLTLYGSKSIKRILFIGLGEQKNYTTDRARSIASKLTRYADELKINSFTVDGDSLSLRKNHIAQAFVEGLILAALVSNLQ